MPDQPPLILIVDDSPLIRQVLAKHVVALGYQVALAANGQQALTRIASQPFDLILLDGMMPEMNGYQVLEKLKADQTLRDIPVIMISAAEETESAVQGILLGAEDYLHKPFDPVILNARIKASLAQKRLRDQERAYRERVERLTEAAAAVENGEFVAASLDDLTLYPDALGRLARVFQHMAQEVRARETRLKQEAEDLRIAMDEVLKTQQVAEIADSEFFRTLQREARRIRGGKPPAATP